VYTAILSVDYGAAQPAYAAESRKLVLDITPPTGTVQISPSPVAPSSAGVSTPVSIQIDARSSYAKIDSWSVDILDPSGGLFTSFDGKWPAGAITWDGRSLNGALVQPAKDYVVLVKIRDEYGNTGTVRGAVSVADLAVASERSAATAKGSGFSPKAQEQKKVMDFALAVGNRDAVVSWKVAIAHATLGVQKTFSGDRASLAGPLSWDGTNGAGALAPEGSYTAILSLDYGRSFKPVTVSSAPFVLDVTPPTGTLGLDPALFSPGRRRRIGQHDPDGPGELRYSPDRQLVPRHPRPWAERVQELRRQVAGEQDSLGRQVHDR